MPNCYKLLLERTWSALASWAVFATTLGAGVDALTHSDCVNLSNTSAIGYVFFVGMIVFASLGIFLSLHLVTVRFDLAPRSCCGFDATQFSYGGARFLQIICAALVIILVSVQPRYGCTLPPVSTGFAAVFAALRILMDALYGLDKEMTQRKHALEGV